MTTLLDRPRLETAKVAVGVTFAANGLAYAGWLARAPAVRDDPHLSARIGARGVRDPAHSEPALQRQPV